MKSNNKKLSLVLLTWSSLSFSSSALIPLTEVPQGLYTSVKKEKQSYHPLLGFMGTYTNTIKNIRFYGAYTPAEAFGRKFKNFKKHPQLQAAADQVPQDPIALLVQWLFPSPGGGVLIANQGFTNDLVKLIGDHPILRSRVIGQILNILSSYEGDAQQPQLDMWKSKCAKEMALMLAKELYPSSPLIASEFEKSNNFQFEDLRGDILAVQPKTKNVKERVQQIRLLTTVLVEAFQYQYQGEIVNSNTNLAATTIESVDARQAELPPYPNAVVQQALLTFFWMKAVKKEEIETLLQAMPSISSGNKLGESYPQEWYENFEKVLKGSPSEAEKALANIGDVFYFSVIHKIKTNPLPPILSFSQAQYPAAYPDCLETSIRNFLQIVLYYKSVNIEANTSPTLAAPPAEIAAATSTQAAIALPLKEEKKLESVLNYLPKNSSRALFQYFENYNIAEASKATHRDNWSRVVSDLNNNKSCLSSEDTCVHYLRALPDSTEKIYEIETSITNTLKVFGHLFQDNTFFDKSLSLKDKLDHLCKLVSRPGFTLSWDIENKVDKSALLEVNEKLLFSINGKRFFNWKFTKGHSELQSEVYAADPIFQHILIELQKGVPTLLKVKLMEMLYPGLLDNTKNLLLYKYEKVKSIIYSLYFSDNLDEYYTLVSYLYAKHLYLAGERIFVGHIYIPSINSMPIFSRLLNMCLEQNIDNDQVIAAYNFASSAFKTKGKVPSLWPEKLNKITRLEYGSQMLQELLDSAYAFVLEHSPNIQTLGLGNLIEALLSERQHINGNTEPYPIDNLLATLSSRKLKVLSIILPKDKELKGKVANFVFSQKDLQLLALTSQDPNDISYLNGFSGLPNLKSLRFLDFSFEKYAQYPKLLEFMLSRIHKDKLEVLDLVNCKLEKLPEESWMYLLQFLSSLPNLREIAIEGDFTNSSPQFFQSLWKTFIGMPKLEDIQYRFKVAALHKSFLSIFIEALKKKGVKVKEA